MKDEDYGDYACDGDCLYDSVSKECDYADFLISLQKDDPEMVKQKGERK